MAKLWLFNKKYLHPWQDPDCKGYWKLEEASGTRSDATSNANNLTDNNTVTQGTGIRGNCADFERDNNETLSITNATQTGLNFAGDHSLFAWVKPESFLANEGVIEKNDTSYSTGSSTKGYALKMVGAANMGVGTSLSKASGYTDYLTNLPGIPAGEWCFIGYTYDAVADGTSILVHYFNGYRINGWMNAILMVQDSVSVFRLGLWADSTYLYDGLMDEACAFNRVVSANDVLWLYLYGLSKVGGGVYTGTPQVSAGFGGGV